MTKSSTMAIESSWIRIVSFPALEEIRGSIVFFEGYIDSILLRWYEIAGDGDFPKGPLDFWAR
jgi:hypothetical protein